MSKKHELKMRMQTLIKRECGLTRREAALAKQCARKDEDIHLLKAKLVQQALDLNKCHKRLQKMASNNARLGDMLQEHEQEIEESNQQLATLREAHLQRESEEVAHYSRMRHEREGVRAVRKCTNTFVNLDALPELIQSLTLREREHSSQLVAFSIDPRRHSQQEVQSLIWQQQQIDGVYSEQWRHLLFDCFASGSQQRTQPSATAAAGQEKSPNAINDE